MSASSAQERVLFIGVVQDGKVVQERAVPAGESVTVGPASDAMFVFPDVDLGTDKLELFAFRDGHYRLRFTTAVKGKLTSLGERMALERVIDDLKPDEDGLYTVPLDPSDKGKLRLPPITILFKFREAAAAAVAAPAPAERLDFRPRYFVEDDEDPVFLGFLALWLAIGVAIMVWVNTVEPKELALEELPDRFTRRVFVVPEAPEPEEAPEDALEDEDADAVAEVEPEPEPEPTPSEEPKTEEEQQVDEAKAIEEAKQKLQEEDEFLRQLQAIVIGTTGSNAEGTVLGDNAHDDYGDVADRLAMAEEAGATLGDGSRIRGTDGEPGGDGDRDIGGVEAGADDGVVDLGSAPEVEAPKGSVATGDLDFGGGDVSAVGKVVQRYRGQLKYCYESSLKKNPSLAGRILISWLVEGGEALDPFIVENTTGDGEFGDCLVKKIKRWRFQGVDDGEAKVPFVFAPEG